MSARLLITMGDVAGVGPEIIAKAWPELVAFSRPTVVGDLFWLHRGIELASSRAEVRMVQAGDPGVSHPGVIPCVAGSDQDLAAVRAGTVSAAAGRAAHDFLTTAIRLVQAGGADAIVTAPLHKEALRAAGLPYPGHTEILAEQTGTRRFGMMLYARTPELSHGLGVIHVTLHLALRDVFARLSTEAVLEKIALLDGVLRRLKQAPPRIGVAGLNPHASDGGLFGSEETALIEPAVRAAQAQGMNASGPWPGDVLFVRARRGEFDGIVAMYHDQGHIPMKLLAGFRAVNISVGLPLIRTSVAHGTAYDIAGKGLADPHSLIEAARVAAQLAQSPNGAPCHTARPVTS